MIPNIFHFCYFGGRPFSLIQYLTIKSAFEVNQPKKMYMYLDTEPTGEWWEVTRPYLTIIPTTPPDHIHGIPIPHPAHKADVVRLQRLIDIGGIYLDLDILCVKPFTPLLQHTVVLGEEVSGGAKVGLCNAVILATPQANFLRRWLEGYDPRTSLWRGFRSQGPEDLYYSEMSVKYPHFLSTIYAEEIHVEPRTSFFHPSYSPTELHAFFTTDTDAFEGGYCHHLWANAAHDHYLRDISVEKIHSTDTTFTRLARRFLK